MTGRYKITLNSWRTCEPEKRTARRGARYAELSAMAEGHLRAELEFWREMELLSGQRQHFKPGLTGETAWTDDEVAA